MKHKDIITEEDGERDKLRRDSAIYRGALRSIAAQLYKGPGDEYFVRDHGANRIAEIYAAAMSGPSQEPMTHWELVDLFPILRGVRNGFDLAGNLAHPCAFIVKACDFGSGAKWAARFIAHLVGFGQIAFNLCDAIPHWDSTQRQAATLAFTLVLERGIK